MNMIHYPHKRQNKCHIHGKIINTCFICFYTQKETRPFAYNITFMYLYVLI